MNKKAIISSLLVLLIIPFLSAQKYGEDSVKCVEQLSLYKINFRIWKDHNYSEEVMKQVPIYKPWKWVFYNCPESSQNIYIDGINILKYFYDNETDEAKKERWVDTMMMVYDNRIKYFGKSSTSREGLVLGRKGVDLYTLAPDRFEEVYKILDRSIALEGNRSVGPVLVYYFRATIACARAGIIDSSAIVENYDNLSEIIEHNIEKSADDPKNLAEWENVKGNIELTFEPFATCKDLIAIFSKKFEKNPDDIDLLKKITGMLDKKGCTDSDLFFEATKNLNDLEPSGESAYLMGVMNVRKEFYAEAQKYFLQAVEILEDSGKIADAYHLLANIAMSNKEYEKGRSYAYKGLQYKPNDGSFYLTIGDMYSATAKDCGDNDLTKKAAFWAAVDKYYKARNVDKSVEEEANKRIDIYSRQFPSAETIFFYDLKEGDPYTVGCWINEATTVRAPR